MRIISSCVLIVFTWTNTVAYSDIPSSAASVYENTFQLRGRSFAHLGPRLRFELRSELRVPTETLEPSGSSAEGVHPDPIKIPTTLIGGTESNHQVLVFPLTPKSRAELRENPASSVERRADSKSLNQTSLNAKRSTLPAKSRAELRQEDQRRAYSVEDLGNQKVTTLPTPRSTLSARNRAELRSSSLKHFHVLSFEATARASAKSSDGGRSRAELREQTQITDERIREVVRQWLEGKKPIEEANPPYVHFPYAPTTEIAKVPGWKLDSLMKHLARRKAKPQDFQMYQLMKVVNEKNIRWAAQRIREEKVKRLEKVSAAKPRKRAPVKVTTGEVAKVLRVSRSAIVDFIEIHKVENGVEDNYGMTRRKSVKEDERLNKLADIIKGLQATKREIFIDDLILHRNSPSVSSEMK